MTPVMSMTSIHWQSGGVATTTRLTGNFKVVWVCHQSLMQLGKHNRVQLIWVPGHEGFVGNEMADQLARTGSEHPFIGPEPACSISVGVAKKAVRDWTSRNHKEYWESLTGLRQRDLYKGPLPKERRIC
jgi:ribonuclease HI